MLKLSGFSENTPFHPMAIPESHSTRLRKGTLLDAHQIINQYVDKILFRKLNFKK